MKATIKTLALLSALLFAAYHIYFFILPSVTVLNSSNSSIQSARVDLPNSGLDFDAIAAKQSNTIHYALEQADGDYEYQFVMANGSVLAGRCGYVTNNQIHKRVTVQIKDNHVLCQSN